METPRPLQSAANEQDDVTITRREYDDENVVIVDFGRGVDASLDVLGDTAIVVAGGRQFEFEIPDGATEVSTNDGMLVIREQPGTGGQSDTDEQSESNEQTGTDEQTGTGAQTGTDEKTETSEQSGTGE